MQFFVQFVLIPLQSIPGLGGPKLADLPVAFDEGVSGLTAPSASVDPDPYSC
jgi:hypothetical protein